MSLVVVAYVPEGIVMASDSRQSVLLEGRGPEGREGPRVETIHSDQVNKTFLLTRRSRDGHLRFEAGISTLGQDLLGGISTAGHIKRFAEEEVSDQDDVTTLSAKLVAFFRRDFPEADLGFHVAGYKKEGKASLPYVYFCHVGRNITRDRKNVRPDGPIFYGATWSGQIDVITGIFQPTVVPGPAGSPPVTLQKPPVLWDAMPLQDAIDFCVFAIRTTIDTIRFQARPKNVGGPIDVLVLTPEGAAWIQKKQLRVQS
jgi:hypothetical protein